MGRNFTLTNNDPTCNNCDRTIPPARAYCDRCRSTAEADIDKGVCLTYAGATPGDEWDRTKRNTAIDAPTAGGDAP